MKKIFFVCIALLQFSQLFSQTTLEEYNYVTKGYKVQLESGLDMKKGYRLIDLHENYVTGTNEKGGEAKRVTSFKGLYRDGQTIPCAVMLIYKRPDTGYEGYLCIPHYLSSKEIWDKFHTQLQDYKDNILALEALIWGLAKSSAFFAQNNF